MSKCMLNALNAAWPAGQTLSKRGAPRRQIGGAFTCPSYLLFDITTAWAEAPTRAAAAGRVAMYLLTPHNYLALALVCRFSERGARLVRRLPPPRAPLPPSIFVMEVLREGGMRE